MIQKEAETYSVQIWRASDDRILRREWRDENGDLHNPDGPALEVWDEITGLKSHEEFYERGTKHRLEGPAFTEWDTKTGNCVAETWRKNGKIHREGGKPAAIRWNSRDNTIANTSYYVDGVLHRADGPASIDRYSDGRATELWMLHGETYRADGLPPINKLDSNGHVIYSAYLVDGQEVEEASHELPGPNP